MRWLERQIGTIARKATRRVAEGGDTPVVVDEPDLKEYLGRLRFRDEDATRAPIPGLATGLAVTGAGGDVLTIEVTGMEGEPGLHVTGQLGEVMSESAHIALSFVRSQRGRARCHARHVRAPPLPPARARGRGAEGRPVGRHHDDDRARVSLLTGPPGEARRRA